MKKQECETARLLKNIRAKFGLTQKALADLMGVGERTISRWERQGIPSNGIGAAAALEKAQELYRRENIKEKTYELYEGRAYEVVKDHRRRILN